MMHIPDFWRVTWNNLALDEAEYTPIESLFCATFEDRLIYLDYGSRHGVPCYAFVYKVGDVERININGISRAEGFARLAYWLVADPAQKVFTAKQAIAAMRAGGLPEGATVTGTFFSLRGDTTVTTLPDHLTVEGILDLVNCTGLAALPNGLAVGHSLNLCGCSSLVALPEDLLVAQSINLGECRSLTDLPAQLQVGGGVYIIDCEDLTTLPTDWTVHGDLEIHGTNAFTALSEGLVVNGTLRLMGQPQITQLPKRWRVKNYLVIDHCAGLGILSAESLKAQTGALDVMLYDPLVQDT
jgi:hypothetical protein